MEKQTRKTSPREMANARLREVYREAIKQFRNEDLDDASRCCWASVLEGLARGDEVNEERVL